MKQYTITVSSYNSLHSWLFVYLPYRCCGIKTVSTSFTERSVNNRRCKTYLRRCSCFWHHISFPNILRFFWDVAYEKYKKWFEIFSDATYIISLITFRMPLSWILIIKDSINSTCKYFTHMFWYMMIHENQFIIDFNFMKRTGDFKIRDSIQQFLRRVLIIYIHGTIPLYLAWFKPQLEFLRENAECIICAVFDDNYYGALM